MKKLFLATLALALTACIDGELSGPTDNFTGDGSEGGGGNGNTEGTILQSFNLQTSLDTGDISTTDNDATMSFDADGDFTGYQLMSDITIFGVRTSTNLTYNAARNEAGRIEQMAFNVAVEVEGQSETDTGLNIFEYDDQGRLIKITEANNMTDREMVISYTGNTANAELTRLSDSQVLATYVLTLDEMNRPTSMVVNYSSQPGITYESTAEYNAENNLITVTNTGGGLGDSITYTYDQNPNPISAQFSDDAMVFVWSNSYLEDAFDPEFDDLNDAEFVGFEDFHLYYSANNVIAEDFSDENVTDVSYIYTYNASDYPVTIAPEENDPSFSASGQYRYY